MSEGTPSRPHIDAWQVHELRAIFFPTLDALPLGSQAGWWQAVVDGQPERIEDRPNVPLHVEEGSCCGGVLTLSAQADRVDWVLAPAVGSLEGLEAMPKIGPFPAVRDDFLATISRWVPSAPDCRRVALTARLLLPVPSRQAGYRLLAAYLPFAPDPDSSTDLRYQINRQRESHIQPGLLINRLQNWAVAFFRKSAAPVAGRLRVPEVVLHESWSIALEADVNTDAESWDKLPLERIPGLMKELADLATELALEGDRP